MNEDPVLLIMYGGTTHSEYYTYMYVCIFFINMNKHLSVPRYKSLKEEKEEHLEGFFLITKNLPW